jgi:hypothetical protein
VVISLRRVDMSQDSTGEITDLDISGEFGEEIMFEEVEARLETEIWCCNTHEGTSDCCGAGNPNPYCDPVNRGVCEPL